MAKIVAATSSSVTPRDVMLPILGEPVSLHPKLQPSLFAARCLIVPFCSPLTLPLHLIRFSPFLFRCAFSHTSNPSSPTSSSKSIVRKLPSPASFACRGFRVVESDHHRRRTTDIAPRLFFVLPCFLQQRNCLPLFFLRSPSRVWLDQSSLIQTLRAIPEDRTYSDRRGLHHSRTIVLSLFPVLI